MSLAKKKVLLIVHLILHVPSNIWLGAQTLKGKQKVQDIQLIQYQKYRNHQPPIRKPKYRFDPPKSTPKNINTLEQ